MTALTRRARPPRLDHDRPMHWAELANCLNMAHPEVMWPLPGADVQTVQAIKVCQGCPSRVECLLDGVDEGEFDSVRGGLTGKQRKLAARLHGRDIDAYPMPDPPQRNCIRCNDGFHPDPAAPLARLCEPCALAREFDERRKDLKRQTRRIKAVTA